MAFHPFRPSYAIAGLPSPAAPRVTRATLSGRSGPGWQFGNEPPLDVGGPVRPIGRHAVSLRWLGASILTGLAGALLLGSAIYVSSEGETTFAELAELAPPDPAAGAKTAEGGLRKGDKLVRAETIASAKQTFRTAMTLRAGDREVIKVRSFSRLSTGLSLTSGTYATNIPTFNPMRFFDGGNSPAERAPEVTADAADAEVTVVKTDLAPLMLEGGVALSDEDAAAQILAELRSSGSASRQTGLPFQSASTFLPRVLGTGAGGGELFAPTTDPRFRSIEVRVVPENVSTLPKSAARAADTAFEERIVSPKRGDSLEVALRSGGASQEDAGKIAAAIGRDRSLDGTQFRLLLAPASRPGEPRAVQRAVLYGERGIEAIAALNDRGSFVSVAPPASEAGPGPGGRTGAPANNQDEDDDDEGTGVRLYESLYETVAKHDLPRQTVEDLVKIFGYDIDFQRRVAAGDSLELFYANEDESGAERMEILSATLSVGNDVRRVFRYQAEDGSIDYLDENGRSLRKFLLRKPVTEARITSPFGSRYHPILGYSKMHTGVDWGAKAGTPIMAAGNGTVIKAEYDGGYGRRTEIQHANGYVTAYNHQSAFARGIAPGAKVRQGQVIGFVGSTGLSTGPHVHYEVIVNGRFVDPMKIRLPRGRELDGRALADFSRQRREIDGLVAKAGASSQLASSDVR